MRKIVGLLLIVFLLMSSSISSSQIELNKNDVIYVDDDNTNGPWDGTIDHPYRFIQTAVNAARKGDVVFVFNGLYEKHSGLNTNYFVKINKQISLVGESTEQTVISAKPGTATIGITAKNVMIKQFTINHSYLGIDVTGVSDAIISQIRINDTNNGIEVKASSDIIIKNSSFIDTRIELRYARSILIENNTFTLSNEGSSVHDSYRTLSVFDSTDTQIRSNQILSSIELHRSWSSNIIDNAISNGLVISHMAHTVDETLQPEHLVIMNNTVRGKPLYFLKNLNDYVIPSDAGQIILVNCSNMTVQHQNLTNVQVSLQLFHSSENIIQDNKLEQSELWYSSGNIIQRNTLCDSDWNLIVHYSSQNIIQENIITGGYYGISIEDSSDTLITNNTIEGNKECGIRLIKNTNTTISSNILGDTIYDRYGTGDNISDNVVDDNIINLYGCSQVIINHNSITKKNNHGIILDNSKYAQVCSNRINTTNFRGINIRGDSLLKWNSHLIWNNTVQGKPIFYYTNMNGITVPSQEGQLILANCSNILIEGRGSLENTEYLQIAHSSQIHIQQNNHVQMTLECCSETTISNNSHIGIQLEGNCHCFLITDNTIDRSISSDRTSSNLTIEHNMIENQGLSLFGTSHVIHENIIRNTSEEGIHIVGSHHVISYNQISDNKKGIYLELYSEHDEIHHNEIRNNTIGLHIGDIWLAKETCHNVIYLNNITNNHLGISLYYTQYTSVEQNNFIDNSDDAVFDGCIFTTWDQNYWNSSRYLPKIIIGEMNNILLPAPFPWLNVDWHPASEPYDI